MNKVYFMLALLLASVNTSHAQKWAVKSNLLYDATATINLGVEAALGRRVTLDVSGNYNPWKFGDAGGNTGSYNPKCATGSARVSTAISSDFTPTTPNTMREESISAPPSATTVIRGTSTAPGLSYGYQWLIGKRWNLEATVGVGYARLWDRKYPIAECGEVIRTRSRNYFGPTKIGLTLIFIIK